MIEHSPECRIRFKSWPCCPEEMCPCDRDAFEYLKEQLRLTQIDNNLLMTENACYREALEFYAKKTLDRSDDVEWLESDEYKECYDYFTGRRAREALKGGE